MKPLSIEPITENDYEAVARLINEVTQKTFAGFYPPKIVTHKASCTKETIAQRAIRGHYFVARRDGELVGVIGLAGDKVRNLFVSLNHQGKGVGKQLYQKVETLAKEQGLKRLRLYASLPAINFYIKQGFKIIKQYQSELHGESYQSTLMKKIL